MLMMMVMMVMMMVDSRYIERISAFLRTVSHASRVRDLRSCAPATSLWKVPSGKCHLWGREMLRGDQRVLQGVHDIVIVTWSFEFGREVDIIGCFPAN